MELAQILSVCGVSGIISGLVGVLIAVYLKRPLEKRVTDAEAANARVEAQNTATMLGVQALLRDRLLQAYHFYKHQGWASYDDKQNVLNLYTQYEILGPNGIMERKHNEFLALPDEVIQGFAVKHQSCSFFSPSIAPDKSASAKPLTFVKGERKS